jgi:hypothetical protein
MRLMTMKIENYLTLIIHRNDLFTLPTLAEDLYTHLSRFPSSQPRCFSLTFK